MIHINIRALAKRLNIAGREHPIGTLQRVRAVLKRLSRRPGEDIFSSKTVFSEGAFHLGGRRELQFNIWLEDSRLRHGVGFFFQRNKTLPDPVGTLRPKVRRFNKFIQLHPDRYLDMRMWHYKDGEQSHDYRPRPIRDELVAEGAIIFLGKRQHERSE